MTSQQDTELSRILDKFYTNRKQEYDKFSQNKIGVNTFKSNCKYEVDQATQALTSWKDKELRSAKKEWEKNNG